MKSIVTVLVVVLLFATPCFAGLRVVGRGDTTSLDPSGFPPSMKASFDIMRVKCIKCHKLERTVVAINTGIAPITGQPCNRHATKAYGVKMLRKPDSNMNKQEVKMVVELMNYLLDEATR